MNGLEFERARRKPKAANIVPLIDIALFLLIFFMVAGTIERFEIIPIQVPEAASGRLVDEGHLVILIGARDEVVVGDDLITMDDLVENLRPQLEGNPDKVITLKADASIPAAKMIRVMDSIKLAGGRNVSLVTRARQEPGRAK